LQQAVLVSHPTGFSLTWKVTQCPGNLLVFSENDTSSCFCDCLLKININKRKKERYKIGNTCTTHIKIRWTDGVSIVKELTENCVRT